MALFPCPPQDELRRNAGRVTARALALGLDRSCSVADGARLLAQEPGPALTAALRRVERAGSDDHSPQGRAAAMLRVALRSRATLPAA